MILIAAPQMWKVTPAVTLTLTYTFFYNVLSLGYCTLRDVHSSIMKLHVIRRNFGSLGANAFLSIQLEHGTELCADASY